MPFAVAPEIFDAFPGMCIAVAVARGVDNRSPRPDLGDAWASAWEEAAAEEQYGNAQSHPRVAPWRERMRAVGVSGKQFPSSIEAMLRRALKGGEPFRINPLVDFYNTVSLRHIVPAGGFDLDGIRGPLELRLTREGDTFQALDEEQPEAVPAGEIAYADGSTVLTRHFVWRQSRDALITTNTTNVILLSEILGGVGEDVARQALEDLRVGLERYFQASAQCFMVDTEQPQADWS